MTLAQLTSQSPCYQLLLLLLSSMAQPLITSGAEEAQLLPNVTQYNCSTALLALNDSDYTEQGSGSLEYSGTVYDIIFVDFLGRPVICEATDLESLTFSKLRVIFALFISFLSIIGSVIILVTYSLFKELRTLPGQVIMNLAAAFLVEDSLTVVIVLVQCRDIECQFLYFGLAQARVIWMSITGFEICRTVYYGYKMKPQLTHKNRVLLLYLLTGWVVPAVVMAVEATVVMVGGYHRSENTSFNKVLLVVLMSILLLTFIFNFIITTIVVVLLCVAYSFQRKLKEKSVKTNTRVFICLMTLLALLWFVVPLLGLTSNSELLLFIALFVGTPQPFTMCVALLCNRKVFRMYRTLFVQYSKKFMTSI